MQLSRHLNARLSACMQYIRGYMGVRNKEAIARRVVNLVRSSKRNVLKNLPCFPALTGLIGESNPSYYEEGIIVPLPNSLLLPQFRSVVPSTLPIHT